MSLIRKVIIGWILCQLLMLVIIAPLGAYFLKKNETSHLRQQAEATQRLVVAAARDLMVATDLENLKSVSKEIADGPDVDFIQFLDRDGHLLAQSGDTQFRTEDFQVNAFEDISYAHLLVGLHTYNQAFPVVTQGVKSGEVRIGHSLTFIRRQLLWGGLLIFGVSVGMGICVGGLSLVMGRKLKRDITILEDGARSIALGEFGTQIKRSETNILVTAIDAFNQMSKRLLEIQRRATSIEQDLRDAVETIPDAFCVYDGEDKLVLCNERYANLLATSGHQAKKGAKFEDLVRSGVDAGVFDIAEEDKEEWIRSYLEGHRRGNVSREIRMASGRWIRVEEHLTARGNIIGFRMDITELKEREQAYRLSEGRLRTTIEASLDCIICIDKNGCITEFNGAAERTFGYRRDEVLGQKLGPLIIPPAFREMHERGIQHYLKTGEGPVVGKRIEVMAMHRDQSEFACELALEASGSGDDVIFVAFMRDITEQRKQSDALNRARERAEAANKAKDEFLAMMTHEIRTPLNGVLGILGLMQDTKLDREQRDYVSAARTSGDILLQILNDILDYSKMEAGKLELENAPLKLHAIIDPVRQILAPRLDTKNLDFKVNIARDLPECIIGDLGRIRQVLLNLANNAVKFTERGHVAISVTKVDALLGHSDTGVMFEVCDTGVGIPEVKHDQLFVEFNQLDASYARKFGGTGLGLAICRELVELMGGMIDFTSKVGEGSKFYFTIPLVEGDPADLSDEDDDIATYIKSETRSCRILVAEDNAVNSMIVRVMLEEAGHRVDTVMDGVEALQAVRSLPYDLILMDVNMPEMDGFQATRLIREMPEPIGTVPIIALTALAMKGDKQRVLDAGMDGYMTKPFSRQQLLTVVKASAKDGRHLGKLTQDSVFEGDKIKNIDTGKDPEDILVDRDVLRKLGEDTAPELVPELLQLYIQDTKRRVDELDAAILGRDFAKIEHQTHTMASSAAMYGAMRLFVIARKTEEYCRNNAQTDALQTAKKVVDIANETFEVFNAIISELNDYSI